MALHVCPSCDTSSAQVVEWIVTCPECDVEMELVED